MKQIHSIFIPRTYEKSHMCVLNFFGVSPIGWVKERDDGYLYNICGTHPKIFLKTWYMNEGIKVFWCK